jgi:hypothetical protein
MIDTEKYQPARQNMKFVTRSLRSLATKLHILARQADIFGINQMVYDITKHKYTNHSSSKRDRRGRYRMDL